MSSAPPLPRPIPPLPHSLPCPFPSLPSLPYPSPPSFTSLSPPSPPSLPLPSPPLEQGVRGFSPENFEILDCCSIFWHAKGGLQMCVFLGRAMKKNFWSQSRGGDRPLAPPVDPPLHVPVGPAKFDVNPCNESPLRGEKTWFLACE